MNNHLSGSRALMMVILLAGVTACGGTPTAPTPAFSVDTFTGTLMTGGSSSHSFTALTSGDVAILVNSVAPVSALQLGLGLGEWKWHGVPGSTLHDGRQTRGHLYGVGRGLGSCCITVYDVGNVTEATTYSVQVTHP